MVFTRDVYRETQEIDIRDYRLSRTVDALFTFNGRIGRTAFLGYSVILMISSISLLFLSILWAGNNRTTMEYIIGSSAFIVAALSFWPAAALLIKRLHDLNYSAWHCLWLVILWLGYLLDDVLPNPALAIVELAALATVIWLLAAPGSLESNNYGEP